MLNPKQIRMLELLDKKVDKCRECSLHQNGKITPFWNEFSKYVIISESPTKSDVRANRPFMGAGSKILRDELVKAGLSSRDFMIINSVQCIPIYNENSGKPTVDQLDSCQQHLRRYIKVVDPEKVLCLGNYAKYIFTGEAQGVLRQRGVFTEYDFGGGYTIPAIFTVHPAYCIYNPDGIKYIRDDILKFRDTKFEQRIDWMFKEEEFLL